MEATRSHACAHVHPGIPTRVCAGAHTHRASIAVPSRPPPVPLSAPGLIVGMWEPPTIAPWGQIHSGVKVVSVLVVRNVSTQQNTRVHVCEQTLATKDSGSSILVQSLRSS